MKKKKLKQFIIILFILLFIFLCLTIKMLQFEKQENNPSEFQTQSTHDHTAVSLGYTNSIYDVYEGKLKAIDISNKITILLEGYLAVNAETMGQLEGAEIEDYFSKNKNSIYKYIGITEIEDFQNFVSKLKLVEGVFEKSPNIEYIEDSFNSEENIDSIKVKFTYPEGKVLNCIIYTSDKYLNGTEFEFRLEIL